MRMPYAERPEPPEVRSFQTENRMPKSCRKFIFGNVANQGLSADDCDPVELEASKIFPKTIGIIGAAALRSGHRKEIPTCFRE